MKGEAFPFAKAFDGGVYVINRQQEIINYDGDDYECEEPTKIADFFREFVEDCLIGKRYTEFFNKNSTYDFYKYLGWC